MDESKNRSDNAPRLASPNAALIGVLALVGAVAAGHLVAGFVGANASPFVAVGNTFIYFTPNWLKDFAVRTFGTSDKLVLLLSMAGVILVIAALAGLASRRHDTPGVLLAVALGIVGAAAVLRAPDLGLAALLAPLVSLAVGVLVFRWLHGKAMALARSAAVSGAANEGRAATWADESAYTAGKGREHDAGKLPTRPGGSAKAAGENGGHDGERGWPQPDRRRFLVSSAAVAVGAGLVGGAGQLLSSGGGTQASRQAIGGFAVADRAPAIPQGADFAKLGTPTFITPNTQFYRVDTALSIPQLRAEDWQLRIHGMVDRELVLHYDDLRRRQLIERTVTMTCVSNDVGGDYISNTNFVGVRLRDILQEAGVKPGADQILSKSSDGFTAGTPVDVIMEPGRDAMLAIGMNGEPLPVEHGFPVRMVVPGLYGYISATKWVVDLELTTFSAKQCYWVQRGWGVLGPIKTESRIDKPAGFGRVQAGKVTIAGIAWAQTKGIEQVEVRVNRGPWMRTQLSTEVNNRTWRMWQIQLDLDTGSKFVECRATDKTGYTQTDQRADPIPDGATGWHSRNFTVDA